MVTDAPNSGVDDREQLEARAGDAGQRLEHHRHQPAHRGAGDHTDTAALPPGDRRRARLDPLLQPSHRRRRRSPPDRSRRRSPRAADPARRGGTARRRRTPSGCPARASAIAAARFDQPDRGAALLRRRLADEMVLAVLRQAHRHHRAAEDRRTELGTARAASVAAPHRRSRPGDMTTWVWNSMPCSANRRS